MQKFIDELNVSDWEIETPNGFKDIKKIFKTIPFKKIKLSFNDGLFLECADTHILINENDNQVFAKDLLIGSKIKSKNGISIVSNIEFTDIEENMYDVEIDSEDHLYYSNDLVSHNTTTAAAYILYELIFNDVPTYAAVLANKGSTAHEILSRVKSMFEELPWFLKPGVVEWNKGSIELGNGSKALAAATSSSSIRGKSINLLYLDEMGHIENDLEFYESTYPVITSGKNTKVLITSTPKGLNLFYKLWIDAVEGRNSFVPLKFLWNSHPLRDEAWAKETKRNVSSRSWMQEFESTCYNTMININNMKIKIGELYDKLSENFKHN